MDIVSAFVARVSFPLPCKTIEGLMTEDESFYVGVPQICTLFSIPTKHASRDFKVLLGKDCLIPKLKTPLHSNPVNAIPLEDFGLLVLELALKGNKTAIQASRGLVGLSLHQMFSDAFNKEFTPQQRQNYIKKHWLPSRENSASMHPWFQQNCIANGYPAWDVHDAITLAIFGQTAEQARQKPLVIDGLDATIGLNHQESPEGQQLLAKVKRKFCLLKNGTWQEKVVRAVDAVKR